MGGGCVDILGINPALEIGAAIHPGNVDPDRVGVGVDAHQEQINGRPTAKTVLDGLLKILESIQPTGGRKSIVAAMGSTTLMAWILGAEVVQNHLQITCIFVGRIGDGLAVTAVLGLHPAVHRVLHIKQGPGMGATPHRTKRQTQGVGNGMGQATIRAGRDVEEMEATGQQEGVEGLSCGATGFAA